MRMKMLSAFFSLLVLASALNAQVAEVQGLGFWMTPSGLPEFWLVENSSEASEWAYFEREMSAAAAVTIGDVAGETTIALYQELEEQLGVENSEWDSASFAVGTLVKTDGTRDVVHGVLLINARLSSDRSAANKDFFVVLGAHQTSKEASAAMEDAVAVLTQIATVTHEATYPEPVILSNDQTERSCQTCRMACDETLRLATLWCTQDWNTCMTEVSAALLGCVALCRGNSACVAICGGGGVVGMWACARYRQTCVAQARHENTMCRQACGPSSI